MRRIATIWVVLTASVALAAEPKDPKTLAVSDEKTTAAKALIARLDDDDVDVRDKASADLKAMGRGALPAILATLQGKASNEVQNRLEQLLPAVRKADFDARYPLFLADKDRTFDHDLLGWNVLKAAVKDTKESRLLMADMLNDEQCREMLLLALDNSGDARKQFKKRWEAKRDEWRTARPLFPAEPTAEEPIHWMLAALVADLLHPHDYHTDYRWFIVHVYLKTDEGKLAVDGKGRYGATTRDLGKYWIEQQTGPCGLGLAHSIALDFKLDEAVIRSGLEKQFELFVKGGTGGGALASLAHTRDPKYIASFRRLFDAEGVYRPKQEEGDLAEIQIRDAALSMCIALSGQDPVDYGFAAQSKADPTTDTRYWVDNYRFDDSGGTKADEKRTAAFKKWAEWEKANPDKLKAKPPEKTGK